MTMIIVYSTFPNIASAKRITKRLLKRRLIACANILPVSSSYWWKEKIVDDEETVVFMKTRKEKYKKVKEELKNIHPYEIPCIFFFESRDAEKTYLEWLNKTLG